MGGELVRVGEQVLQHAAHEREIRLGEQPVLDLDLDPAVRLRALQLGDDLARQRAQIDRYAHHPPARQARELQHRVDQLAHPHRPRADPLEVVPALLAHLIPTLVAQQLAERVHRSQRRAEVVRDRIGERLQLPVRPLEIRGARGDALLELGVQRPYLLLGLAYAR